MWVDQANISDMTQNSFRGKQAAKKLWQKKKKKKKKTLNFFGKKIEWK